MRRLILLCLAVLLLVAPAASALTLRDVVELSKAGIGDDVLLALIEVDPRVYTMDAGTVKMLKAEGVSEPVIVALVRSGRTNTSTVAPGPVAEPVPAAEPTPSTAPAPQVVVIDHHDSAAVREVAVPVAVPVYVPIATAPRERVSRIIQTDDGSLVRANVPVPAHCTKAEPVYWGNGGKRRPGTWEPPTQIVCR